MRLSFQQTRVQEELCYRDLTCEQHVCSTCDTSRSYNSYNSYIQLQLTIIVENMCDAHRAARMVGTRLLLAAEVIAAAVPLQ